MEKLLLVRLSEDFYNKMAEASPFPSTVKARAMFLPELDTFVGTKKQIEETRIKLEKTTKTIEIKTELVNVITIFIKF